ncbi:MAG: hypothetical protein PWR10_1529 [Halanaerobiales bacterium]|nr:hypothetical protein [Halanaerobiales bacterium]
MKFFDYLWALLNRPLKKGQENKKWFTALGAILEDAKQAIFQIRRAWFILTAPGPALDVLGKARGLPRYANESNEAYRKRLLNAFETYVLSGTDSGMLKALSALGYDNTEIQPVYEVDPERWSELYIFIDQDIVKELNNFDIVQKEARRVKRAIALLNYVFTYYETLRVRSYDFLGRSTRRPACGTFKGKEKEFYKVTGYVENREVSINKRTIEGIFNPLVSSKKTKINTPGALSTSDLTLVSLNNSLINNKLMVSSQRTKSGSTAGKGFYKVVSLNGSSLSEQSNLRVCKNQLKTIRTGFENNNNISLLPGVSYTVNSLPVCSKNTKTRRVVS